jgi:hypothetical protein
MRSHVFPGNDKINIHIANLGCTHPLARVYRDEANAMPDDVLVTYTVTSDDDIRHVAWQSRNCVYIIVQGYIIRCDAVDCVVPVLSIYANTPI